VDIFLGRQPILGRKLEVFAYELLYRDGNTQVARITDGDQATSRVLLSAFAEIGLERVIGDRLAFVNLTRGFVVGKYPLPLSCDRLVLEVLETVKADKEVLEGLKRLKGQGYRIALDDFQVTDSNRALLPLADIIKLDVQALPGVQLERELERLSKYRVQFLAEKVETQEEYETCKGLGIEFFQGYFFARPKLLHACVLPTQRAALVALLARLYSPDCTLDNVRAMVECDLAISYRLLQHINSSLYGLRCRVQSIRDTVLFLGLYKVRSLISLFLLAAMEGSQPALIETALVRARCAELLAKLSGAERTDAHFTAGMFSCLDAMLDVPMSVAIERLPLAEPVRAALTDGSGEIGRVLQTVLAYERGDWVNASLPDVPPQRLREAFLEAAEWARTVQQPERAAA
jgi:c-di-GMP phosphodiesterase